MVNGYGKLWNKMQIMLILKELNIQYFGAFDKIYLIYFNF